MRLTTLHRMAFTGEYWNYTTEQGLDGQITNTFYKERDIKFNLVSAEKGTMYLFADEQLRYNTQIRGLKDTSGNLIFTDALTGDPEVSYVGVSEPVFDIYGTLTGYRHDLSQGL